MVDEVKKNEKIWKKFLIRHWKVIVLLGIIAAVAITGAIYVYLWFVDEALATSLVPQYLSDWSIGYIITFLLNLVFWELIYIGIPVLVVVGIILIAWWKRMPEDERKEYRKANLFGKRSKRSDGGGAISFLVFIFFCIIVWLDGNWGLPFGLWEFTYLVYTCLWAFIYVLIIFGIPVLVGGLGYLYYKMNK